MLSLTDVFFFQPPKQDKKKDAGKSKKDKDPVNKSGGKAKKKVCFCSYLPMLDGFYSMWLLNKCWG